MQTQSVLICFFNDFIECNWPCNLWEFKLKWGYIESNLVQQIDEIQQIAVTWKEFNVGTCYNM